MRIVLRTVIVLGALAIPASATADVTFNKDVLPILQTHCQMCHRPGEVAPMSLLTFADARPWARAIKAAVLLQKMPPWPVEPQYDHEFSNAARLTPAEREILAAWADGGAAEGDAADKPAPVTFVDGWNLNPDLIVEMPNDFQVQATGTIEYQYMLVKANFTEDVWVRAAEMRPGNSKVVHHGEVWVLPPGSKWMADAVPGVAYPQTERPKIGEDDIDILGKLIPVLARRRSTSATRRNSSRRVPIWSSRSTIRRSARRRSIARRSASSSRRGRTRPATSRHTDRLQATSSSPRAPPTPKSSAR